MRRLVILIAAAAITASACAGTSPGSTGLAPETSPTLLSAGEIQAAADFTLALGGGGSYVLSEDVNPVYMIFWAEW